MGCHYLNPFLTHTPQCKSCADIFLQVIRVIRLGEAKDFLAVLFVMSTFTQAYVEYCTSIFQAIKAAQPVAIDSVSVKRNI
jgi:hypothetical protein